MCDPVEELALAFSAVEVDGFKVGGYIPVCNAVLEDSLINLADYIESKLATAIAKALDKAIVAGTGTTGKQPTGIINGVTPTALTGNKLSDILATMGGLKDDNLGVVKIAMRRSDYFGKVFGQLIGETDAGQMVTPNIAQANIAGIPIIFSDDVPAGGFIIGDFKKYLLAERSGTRFEASRDVQFIQDNTVFKMTARYDGKPVDAEYFGYYTFAAEV
jgi:HK97 family phage major capsid protein